MLVVVVVVVVVDFDFENAERASVSFCAAVGHAAIRPTEKETRLGTSNDPGDFVFLVDCARILPIAKLATENAVWNVVLVKTPTTSLAEEAW